MKRFTAPKMNVIELAGEDVLCASTICNDKVCSGYDCPDCPTQCEGIYHCNIFRCPTYQG